MNDQDARRNPVMEGQKQAECDKRTLRHGSERSAASLQALSGGDHFYLSAYAEAWKKFVPYASFFSLGEASRKLLARKA